MGELGQRAFSDIEVCVAGIVSADWRRGAFCKVSIMVEGELISVA